MTYVLIGIAIIVVVLIFAAMQKKKIKKGNYYAVAPLSNPEQILYWKLKEALGDDYVVLAQVSFSRFIKTKNGDRKSNSSMYYKARQKVADYVICNKDFSIAAVIELDDKTHKKELDTERDAIVEGANIKVIRWNVKQLPSKEDIQEKFR